MGMASILIDPTPWRNNVPIAKIRMQILISAHQDSGFAGTRQPQYMNVIRFYFYRLLNMLNLLIDFVIWNYHHSTCIR
jgi:hypothetical protein